MKVLQVLQQLVKSSDSKCDEDKVDSHTSKMQPDDNVKSHKTIKLVKKNYKMDAAVYVMFL